MIYNPKDIKTACNKLLRAVFDNKITVYDGDTFDGYKRPSFFTEIRTSRLKGGLYTTTQTYSYIITYFEENHDEAHCYDVYESIVAAFNPAIKVGKKKMPIESLDMQFIDERNDKMQITIRFTATREIGGNSEINDRMESVELNIERKE